MSLLTLWRGWLKFWFEPASPMPMALYRIVYGLIVLWFGFLLCPDLLFWFGPASPVSNPVSREWPSEILLDPLILFPQTDTTIMAAFAILMISAFSLTIGLFSRASAFLLFLGLVSFHHHNWLILNSGDTIMRISALYLAVSNCGDALSVDRLIKTYVKGGKEPRTPQPKAPWAQRLMQIQLTLLYCQAFFSKLAGEMWVNGTALYYTTRLEDFRRFYFAPIADNVEILKYLTWATLAVELSLFTLIWLKDLRYIVIALGLLLHISIDLTMNLPIFQWLMMAAFIPFVYPEDLEKWANQVRRFFDRILGPPRLLIYESEAEGGAENKNAVKAELHAHIDIFKRTAIVNASLPAARESWRELLAGHTKPTEISTYGSSLLPPGAG